MLALRKSDIVKVLVTLLLMLLMTLPAAAAEENGQAPEICETPDGSLYISYTNIYYDDAYFQFCSDYETSDEECVETWVEYLETTTVEVPNGECLSAFIGYCQVNPTFASTNLFLAPPNGCIPSYEPLGTICAREGWPACPVSPTCDGGAGLYPPSNSGVPYNGYNEFGNFILAVDNHCDQDVALVDVFTGDPLTEVMQVMTLPVGPNGWTQFSEDDIQNIRDTYDYAGEIWFRVHGIGDRYYGLNELMTHPNLGSAD